MTNTQTLNDTETLPSPIQLGGLFNDGSISLGELAAADSRKAEVLRKFGFDYCCGGKMSLLQACTEKGFDIALVEKVLQDALQIKSVNKGLDFNRWDLDFLTDYIYNEHHRYFYDEEPQIYALLQKVVGHHVATHPFLKHVSDLYILLQAELHEHFLKEENIIFPHIKALVKARDNKVPVVYVGISNILGPIQIMENEHEAAGEILHQMNSVTNNYTPPADACSSFILLYDKLKSLDEDLHQHIHLENNILFLKAAKLEKAINKER